jgi:hypothetical protein
MNRQDFKPNMQNGDLSPEELTKAGIVTAKCEPGLRAGNGTCPPDLPDGDGIDLGDVGVSGGAGHRGSIPFPARTK